MTHHGASMNEISTIPRVNGMIAGLQMRANKRNERLSR
jgi:hypothetical protein